MYENAQNTDFSSFAGQFWGRSLQICKTVNETTKSMREVTEIVQMWLPRTAPCYPSWWFLSVYTSTSPFFSSVVIVGGDRYLFQHNSCHTRRRMASVSPSRLILCTRLAGLLVCVPWYQETFKRSSQMQHKELGWDLVVEEWGHTSLWRFTQPQKYAEKYDRVHRL